MKYDLSILLPSIRPGNLKALYNSIDFSCAAHNWELIVAGPYELPPNVKYKGNIKYIQTYRCPTASQQLALLEATGNYVSWAADDGVFLPCALDIGMKSLYTETNAVICGKYNEGAPNPEMADIKYYYISTHNGSRAPGVPQDCLMLMVGIVPREMLLEIGGLDCRYEALPMAFNDWSIRLYNKGVKFIFQKEQMFSCGHMPGHQGDHGPIHDGQTLHDEPIFKGMYAVDRKNINIPLDNWKQTEEIWTRRFINDVKYNVFNTLN